RQGRFHRPRRAQAHRRDRPQTQDRRPVHRWRPAPPRMVLAAGGRARPARPSALGRAFLRPRAQHRHRPGRRRGAVRRAGARASPAGLARGDGHGRAVHVAMAISLEHSIRTPRLTLRRMTAADAPRVYEIQSKWNVTRMLRLASFPPTLDELHHWLAQHEGEWLSGTAYRFALVAEERIIG